MKKKIKPSDIKGYIQMLAGIDKVQFIKEKKITPGGAKK